MFRLTFLGTSSGIPTKNRNVSALALESLAKDAQAKSAPWLLIDCGEGTQHQLLKSPLSLANLTAICITHVHGDHCYGLVGLLSSMAMHARTKPLTLITPKAIAILLDTFAKTTEFRVNYPIDFIFIEDVLADSGYFTLSLSGEHRLNIEIIPLSHRTPSYAFAITQTLYKRKLDTAKLSDLGIDNRQWGQIFKAENPDVPLSLGEISVIPSQFIHEQHHKLKIVIAGDNDSPELLMQACENATALVHEATHLHAQRQKQLERPVEQGGFDPRHSSSLMTAKFASDVKLPTLILTHFSAKYALHEDSADLTPNMGHIKAEAQSVYQGNLILAQDFMRILVTCDECTILQ